MRQLPWATSTAEVRIDEGCPENIQPRPVTGEAFTADFSRTALVWFCIRLISKRGKTRRIRPWLPPGVWLVSQRRSPENLCTVFASANSSLVRLLGVCLRLDLEV